MGFELTTSIISIKPQPGHIRNNCGETDPFKQLRKWENIQS